MVFCIGYSSISSKSFVLYVVLITSLFVCSASSVESYDISHDTLQLPGGEQTEERALITWGRRRSLAEKTLLLAEERTRRRDPMNSFKEYTGGWNITEKHYWTSVGFTAAPFFGASIVWFVVFGLSLFCICICYCCCSKDKYGYSRTAYCLALATLIIFTLVAIAGCVVLYMGQGLFYKSTTKTMGYIVHEAEETAQNLKNVSDYLSQAKKIGVDAIVLPQDIQKTIDDAMETIKKVSTIVSDTTDKTAKKSNDVLLYVRVALIVVSAVMLLLVFLGFVLSMCGVQCLVYSLVVIGWILVTGTFILCGVFLLLHNVFADACVSMDEWVQKRPTANTALDELLPCVDKDTVQGIMQQTKMATFVAVNVVNRVITDGANLESPPEGSPFNFNQSGAMLPPLCNPLNEDKTERKCAPGEVELQQAPQVWKKYMCQVSAAGQCVTLGRLTPTYYDQLSAFASVTYALVRYSPYFSELMDCTFVRKTFSDITKDHCPGLRLHSKWIYIGLFMVSLAVMFSMIFWVIYSRERRHRKYTKKCDSARSYAIFG